jgi:hypothetical protein
MRNLAQLVILALLQSSLAGGMSPSANERRVQDVVFQVANQSTSRDIPRIGINLGSRTSWGAEQLMANVLANPGFEPTIDGAIVSVRDVSGSEFTDDSSWLKRADHFWDQAAFSIRTGRLAGVSGRILESGTWQGYSHFRADRELKGLTPGDVIALSRESDNALPSQWWWENHSRNRIRTDPAHPAHSAGVQSLVLAPDDSQPVTAISYVDMIGERSGKLLPLSGSWEVRFWAKSAGRGQLTVQFKRLNAKAFLRQTVFPCAEWREYKVRFTPQDFWPAAGLEFRLEAQEAGARIWIDDVSLAPSAPPPSGFRSEVIETLKQLHPGYLRDWQGQLGDSFANRLAASGGRRPFRYRPGDETAFGYSLPEFLELCKTVDALPWVVLPTTLSDEEWSGAGEYLHSALARYGFREIIVEFGNENWNSLFRPAGIMDAHKMAEAAQRGFRLLKAASGDDPRILPAVGGQFVNAEPIRKAILSAPDAKIVAMAPYYATSVKQTATLKDGIPQLFAVNGRALDQFSKIAAQDSKDGAIYEMNAHSLEGDAGAEDVSQLVGSAAAGSAILYHSLIAMEYGIMRQCLYSLAGFDTFRKDGKLIRLFGLARDLATTGRLRPTGLAMALANKAIAGDMYKVTMTEPKSASGAPPVAIAAFRSNGRWSLVAASASPKELQVAVEFPPGSGELPTTLLQLASASPLSTNESATEVSLQHLPIGVEVGRVRFRLAPYGSAAAYSEPAGVSNRNRSQP